MNLDPAGASYSIANAVSGTQQVGIATFGGQEHATLWTGTAASRVDLDPVNSAGSQAYGVYNGRQVGYSFSILDGRQHAGMWSGTAASWTDLSVQLPANYSDSFAYGVWRDTTTTYVVGFSQNDTTGQYDAILWTVAGGVPVPSSGPWSLATLAAGLLGAGVVVLRRRRAGQP